MVLKRKKIVVFTSALLLGISCYLGLNMTNSGSEVKPVVKNTETKETKELSPGDALAVSANENYFVKTKNDKEIIRSKATELLRTVIDDENTSPEAKTEAENTIIAMASDMDKETKIESLLAAKGFKENVVFISDGLATVTLKSNNLTNEEVAKINDIVSEITGNNNTKIVEVN